jgi:DNA-binding response OmpR family regulator
MAHVVLLGEVDRVRKEIELVLVSLGHTVQVTDGIFDSLELVRAVGPDLIILDLSLADMAGVSAVRILRRASDTVLIAVTRGRDERGAIAALHVGADDCVTLPVSDDDLAARAAAALRRTHHGAATERLTVGELSIDTSARSASLAGRPLDLRKLEFDLLALLAARAGTVVSRQELCGRVWKRSVPNASRTLDVHICWLRQKLRDPVTRPRYIRTVRGVGFTMPERP